MNEARKNNPSPLSTMQGRGSPSLRSGLRMSEGGAGSPTSPRTRKGKPLRAI